MAFRRKGQVKRMNGTENKQGRFHRQRQEGGRFYWFAGSFAAALIVLMLVSRIPLPLYAYGPGGAQAVAPLVSVGGQDGETAQPNGVSIRMLTVRLSGLTLPGLLRAWSDPAVELRSKRQVFGEETAEEYGGRMQVLMRGAQHEAIRAIYEIGGIPYEEKVLGVYVQQVAADSPLRELLHPGDRLIALGGAAVTGLADLKAAWTAAAAGLSADDAAGRTFELERGSGDSARRLKAEVPAGTVESARGSWMATGVVATELRELSALDPERQIRISVEEVGGPSAGLAFALEAYERLNGSFAGGGGGGAPDGFIVAATGSITAQGEVCPVGGIKQKLEAAALATASLVLVPADRPAGTCGLRFATANGSEAEDYVRKRAGDMQIRAVATLDEAITAIRETLGQAGGWLKYQK